ncbi:MAG: zinc-dependent peptidase [Bacteroidota bacterium]|nr:zinc-dependent peptidase [Bacteroidota bacterium]
MKFWLRKNSRQQIIKKGFPADWLEIIENNVRFYNLLPASLKEELQQLVQIFLAEKFFEGCAGLLITDEIKLTIAAQACILLLGQDHDIYPKLRTILVYPTAYFAPETHYLKDGTMIESIQFRFGESWARGQVVLAWDEIKQDTLDINDGQNLVYHEFAHQLDHEYGIIDSIPDLLQRTSYVTWARIISNEYDRLVSDIMNNRQTLLNEYGATNQAEFFAVATEYYFEKPIELKKLHPDLYDQLKDFYNIDTALLIQRQI